MLEWNLVDCDWNSWLDRLNLWSRTGMRDVIGVRIERRGGYQWG